MELIDDRGARHSLVIPVQVIGARDAGVPGAEIAQIDVVAEVPVDAGDMGEAGPHRAAVTDPIDAGKKTEIEGAVAIKQSGCRHFFERRARRGSGILRYRTAEIAREDDVE